MSHTITQNIIVDQATIDTLTGDLADLVPTITAAQAQQDTLEAALSNDESKTEQQANDAALAEAVTLKQSISKGFKDRKDSLQLRANNLVRKTQGVRKIADAVDLGILQGFVALFTTKTKLLTLAAASKEAARAGLLIPSVKHQLVLSDAEVVFKILCHFVNIYADA